MEAVPSVEALRQFPIFQGIASDQLARIRRLLSARVFAPGANIMSAEDPGSVAYIVGRGTIKVHVEQAEGSDVILSILGAGEVLGEMSLVDSLGRSASAIAMEESVLYSMGRADFRACLETIPSMTYNLVGILSRRLRMANVQIQTLATLEVHGRITRHLLAAAHEYGESVDGGGLRIPFRLTQSELASLVGASRGRVNQVLVAARREGLIDVDSASRITILDPVALATWSPAP